MNLRHKVIFSFVLISAFAQARKGCLDNSYHLARRNDPKIYHAVECNCECEKKFVMLPNGTCTKCWHRHDSMYLQNLKPETSKKLVNIAQLKKYRQKKQSS